MEFLYFPRLDEKKINSFVHFNNHEIVEESIAGGKGTFFLSGHLSNWEMTAFAYAIKYRHSLNIIAKIQASRELNAKINEYRELSGNKIIEIGLSLKDVFKKLGENRIVCFLVDQSAVPDYSAYIDFFGKEVPAFSGPAKIALRYRPGLIVAYGIRDENYKYNIYFEKIDYEKIDGSGDEEVKRLTQIFQSRFEEVIRKYPGQWLWFHKRFKHARN